MAVACLNCGRKYPAVGVPYCCPACGGLFDELEPLTWREPDRAAAGVWRYARPHGEAGTAVSLGEGNTPLLSAEAAGRRVYFKCEYSNPTGSFKDRGSAMLVSFLLSRGIHEAAEDSSGNAGASFAAYASRAGITARIFAPDDASELKRKQIEAYGALLIAVPGPRTAAAYAVLKASDDGAVYASHAYLPHNLEGYATCAYEIVEELGRAPGSVIVPAGQGGFLLGLGRGFDALQAAGRINNLPTLIGVQAAACAPLSALFEVGLAGLNLVTEGPTLAEGVRVRTPLRADAVLRMVRATGGRILAVAEDQILPGRDALARLGFYVEPTSALIWQPLNESVPEIRDPVVAILTGSGYKAAV
jgi:threonine synthase